MLPGAAHRRGAARAARVHRRRGDRRPQLPLRHSLPRRRARSHAAAPGSRTDASTRSASRAGSCATRCRTSSSARSRSHLGSEVEPCHRASPTRRRPPRCSTRCSSAPARSACSASTTCSRSRSCAPTRPRASSASPSAPRAARASTSCATAPVACSTSARPPTSAPACARTSGGDRRKVPQLLRETEAIDWVECADDLEASVRELRLIQELDPRFNRQAKGKGWRAHAYLKLNLGERFPRLAVARAVREDDGLYLGPLAHQRRGHRSARRDRSRGPAPALHRAHRPHLRPGCGTRAAPRPARRHAVPVPRARSPTPTTRRRRAVVHGLARRPDACCSSRSRRAWTSSLDAERYRRGRRHPRPDCRARRGAPPTAGAHRHCAPTPADPLPGRRPGSSSSSTASCGSPGDDAGRRAVAATRARPTRRAARSWRAGSNGRRPPDASSASDDERPPERC